MSSIKLTRRFLWAAMLLLSSCAGAPSEPAALIGRGGNPCDALTLRAYDPAFMRGVAGEIDAAPPAALWPRMVEDYGALRAEVRACRSVRP